MKQELDSEDWQRLLGWYQSNGRHWLPWRKERSIWSIFLAENLLRRTRAETVARVFEGIISLFPNASSVLSKKREWLLETQQLGFPKRFEKFFEACEAIVTDFDGEVPEDDKSLLELPGIGHYACNAIQCFGSGKGRYLIDTNTLRIASRLSGKEVGQARHRSTDARNLIEQCFGPEINLSADKNFALLDLASLVCKRLNPGCNVCPLRKRCAYYVGRE